MKFMKLGSKADSFQSDGNMRYVATELAADLVVNVGDIKFCVHKFPLLSKSARLQKLLANSNNEVNNEVHIPDIPGGASAFEICAKFCYGMVVTLNPFNVIAARCAAEYLEMHEVVEKGNLIYKIEVFLNTGIFRSWKDSIIVLQTTRSFYPWSEELKVIGRSVDYIALMATVDPGQVDWSYTYSRRKLPSENGIDLQWNGVRQQMTVPKDWWVEDLCELEIDFYKRVIIAIKSKRIMSGNLIGEALKAYALKWLPAFGRDQVHSSEATRNRSLVETVIWLLPSKKGCVPCGFLLKLLKAGTLLDIGETAKRELVKKVGIQLDEASAVDLLLPAPVGEGGLYDIDIVQNMVEEFLIQEQSARIGHPAVEDELLADERSSSSVSYASKLAVSKVIDGYLVEIAHDPDLPLTKFIELAEMVPDAARPVHDGLYRAIDIYLKEHPGITKSEKKRICKLMDCRKLSIDACAHATQNERLPLRVVVQVLFFEQVRCGASGGLGSVDISGAIRTLLPPENGGSIGSSRTATTNTEEDWDGVAAISDDLRSIKRELEAMRVGGGKRGGGDVKNTVKVSSKMRGILKSGRIFSKLLSHNQKGENSSSDTSESPGSVNPGETKSTPSRNRRRSMS
ncbi:BTB/POZ domain-containing protein NPY3-like isoform X1 [Nymphaea colorata]|nr:BTB/POZ domain-containing protein NPY3-like isoform X1 [Nymphaea colorata]